MAIENEKFGGLKTDLKKKVFRRKGTVSVKELEKPYLRLVYFNPFLPLRKY